MHIAEVLGKSLEEVRAFPASEITLWASYFKIKNAKPEEAPKSDADGFKKLVKA